VKYTEEDIKNLNERRQEVKTPYQAKLKTQWRIADARLYAAFIKNEITIHYTDYAHCKKRPSLLAMQIWSIKTETP